MQLISYDDYMNKSIAAENRSEGMAAHREYYAQMVNANTISFVVASIGHDAIMASNDIHLNDIPLSKWDSMRGTLPAALPHASIGMPHTLSSTVCIAKEAARQYKEQNS